jgi:retinol-binding protein 3
MTPHRLVRRAAALAVTLALAGVCMGDGPGTSKSADSSAVLEASTRDKVAAKLADKLESTYVFPDVAKKMSQSIRDKVASKAYDSCTTAPALAKQLTDDMQAISHDKHLRVRYSGNRPGMIPAGEPSTADLRRMEKLQKKQNAGFVKLERLPGNIGLIELHGFADHLTGASTVAAAMNFLHNTDALIFDIRRNGGGDGKMVQLICSYLLPDDKPIHLNSFYWRKGDRMEEFWTLKDLLGKRYLDKDVYVLTSGRTFSAAEEFTYNLKNLKRATIVGETTGGGAHPGGMVPLGDKFAAFIATGRAINPITKTNWEGTGVKPDVEVDADKALDTARELALKKLCDSTKDSLTKEILEHDLQDQQQYEKWYKERKAK